LPYAVPEHRSRGPILEIIQSVERGGGSHAGVQPRQAAGSLRHAHGDDADVGRAVRSWDGTARRATGVPPANSRTRAGWMVATPGETGQSHGRRHHRARDDRRARQEERQRRARSRTLQALASALRMTGGRHLRVTVFDTGVRAGTPAGELGRVTDID
jgi:hypothetical protein